MPKDALFAVTYVRIGDEESYDSLYETWRHGRGQGARLVARGSLDAMVAAKRLMETSNEAAEEVWS
jgi:hypothetical protein